LKKFGIGITKPHRFLKTCEVYAIKNSGCIHQDAAFFVQPVFED